MILQPCRDAPLVKNVIAPRILIIVATSAIQPGRPRGGWVSPILGPGDGVVGGIFVEADGAFDFVGVGEDVVLLVVVGCRGADVVVVGCRRRCCCCISFAALLKIVCQISP